MYLEGLSSHWIMILSSNRLMSSLKFKSFGLEIVVDSRLYRIVIDLV